MSLIRHLPPVLQHRFQRAGGVRIIHNSQHRLPAYDFHPAFRQRCVMCEFQHRCPGDIQREPAGQRRRQVAHVERPGQRRFHTVAVEIKRDRIQRFRDRMNPEIDAVPAIGKHRPVQLTQPALRHRVVLIQNRRPFLFQLLKQHEFRPLIRF